MTAAVPQLLIVDDDSSFLASLRRALQSNFVVVTATDESSATSAFSAGPDMVLLDIRLDEANPHDRTGVELLKKFLAVQTSIPIVMASAHGDMETAVECMRLGASDFIDKAVLFRSLDELRQRLTSALERARLSRKVEQLEEQLERLEPLQLVGTSPPMQKIKDLLPVVAQDGFVNVLIRGETGTGKELVAHAIHALGRRRTEPFVSVAIAALNPNLVESELFGHEAGAFTGANKLRIGFIEKAKGGCLFFDEIGDLPGDAQLKLLRFLEERRFSRVGSTAEIEVDVQILCATHRDLEAAVAEGRIRKDLYFRLKSMQVVMPPLRERSADIPLLCDHFLNLFRHQGRSRINEISEEAGAVLRDYHWPGNVRELKAVLERATIYSNYHGHDRIEKKDLSLEELASDELGSEGPVSKVEGNASLPSMDGGIDLDFELARAELLHIERALLATQKRKTDAWKLLGLNDRFALLRRAKNLLQTFPELGSQFPTVEKLYGKRNSKSLD